MALPEEINETQILAALLGIAEMVSDLADTHELLEAVVRITPSLVRVNRCALLAYDEPTHEFRTSVFFAPPGSGSAFEGLRIQGSEMPRLADRLVKLHLPALLKADSRDAGLPSAVAKRLGLRSALLVPLVSRGRMLGVLWLDHSEHSHYFTSKEVNVAQGVATSVAGALDRASSAEALTLERHRFEALARTLSDGVIVLDRDLRVLEIDRYAEELLGWTSAEVRGRPAHEVFAITEAEAGVAWTRIADAPAPVAKTLRLRARSGRTITREVLAVPVRGDEGETVQVLYILTARPPGGGRTPVVASAPSPR